MDDGDRSTMVLGSPIIGGPKWNYSSISAIICDAQKPCSPSENAAHAAFFVERRASKGEKL
jgi:hypothetical protein